MMMAGKPRPAAAAAPPWGARSLRVLHAVTGLLLVALLLGGIRFWQAEKAGVERKARENLAAVSMLKSQQIADWRRERLADAGDITAGYFMSEAVGRWLARPQAGTADFMPRLRRLQERGRLADIRIVDGAGKVRFGLAGQPGELHAAPRAALAVALRQGQPEMTDLYRDGTGSPRIDVIAPLLARDGRIIGAAILQIAADKTLYPMLQTWPTPSASAETLLVRRDGDAVLFLNDLRHRPDSALKLRLPLADAEVPAARAALGRTGAFAGRDYRGVPVLSVLAAIPDSPWLLVAKIDNDEVYGDWRNYSTLLLALMAAVFGVALVAMFWLRGNLAHAREMQRVNLALRENASLISGIMDALGQVIAVLDEDDTIMGVNRAWREFVAANDGDETARDGVGLPYPDFLRLLRMGEAAAEVLAGIREVRQRTRAAFGLECAYLSRGQPRWFVISVMPLREPLQGVVVSHDDTTARKLAELELETHRQQLESRVAARTADLATSEARTRAVLHTMLDGVAQIDPRGTILLVNNAVTAMFGYEEEELVGRNINMLMPEPYRSAHDGYLRRYQETRQPTILGKIREVEGRRKDGSVFPLDLATNELADDAGTTYIGVMHDITERKAVEVQREAARGEAEHLARVRSEFLANMSHEIRTPLNGVLGMAQIGARDHQGTPAGRICERIVAAGQHLLDVVNDILDYSKMEAGKLVIETRPFRLAQAIDEAAALVADRAADQGLGLHVEPAADLPEWVVGDDHRLRQILVNLLSNAIKFTKRGQVDLAVRRDGEHVLFRVSDTGIGMTDAEMASLFKPFEQADASTTRRFGGTGLGLAISRDLAISMGGDIAVESSASEGSVFTLRLPLPSSAPGVEAAGRAPNGGPRLAGLRVLAADDVELNRVILEHLLAREGARVTFAENGQQAVDHVMQDGPGKECAFDVVLMDVQMPVMDGLEATRRIRGIAPELPVISLTAHAMAEERDKCLAAGMVAHVAKPIDLDVLVTTILRHVAAAAESPATTAAAATAAPPKVGAGDTPGSGPAAPAAPPPAPAAAPPAPEAPSQTPAADGLIDLIDRQALLARFEGRLAFISKLATTVLNGNAETPTRLRAAARGGDLAAMTFIAHGLKSVGGNFEARRLQALATRTETAAKPGPSQAPDLAPQLALDLADMLEALLAELADHYQDKN